MKRPPAPNFIRVSDRKVLDEYALVQFVFMTSVAEGEEASIDINILDVVDMSKAFALTSSTNTKTTEKPEKYSIKIAIEVYVEQSKLSQVHDRGVFEPQV